MALNCSDSTTYTVSSSVEIGHSYHFIENVFDPSSPNLAELYRPWKRCLAIVDYSVYNLYGTRIKAYFKAHDIFVTVNSAYITEDRKSINTLLEICSWINDFDLIRREPVLVIGGGLVTDVVGFDEFSCIYVAKNNSRFWRLKSPNLGFLVLSIAGQLAISVYQQLSSASSTPLSQIGLLSIGMV